MKQKPIAKTVHIGKANLIRLANKVIDMVYQDTVYKHKGVDGKPFEKYSKGYRSKKSSMGTGGKGGSPDLVLSGKMMSSLIIKEGSATDDSIPAGWVNPKSSQKLEWNASDRGKKRRITKDTGDFPFARHIEEWFYKSIDRILSKKVKKTSSRTVVKIRM